MFVIDWKDSSAEAEIDLKAARCGDSNRLPAAALDVIRGGAENPLDLVVLRNQIVPEHSEILRV